MGVILDKIQMKDPRDQVLEKLHITPQHSLAGKVDEIIKEGMTHATPRGLYRKVRIQEREEHGVVVEGIHLHSRCLCRLTASTGHLFPFLATCGSELAQWAENLTDLWEQYIAGILQELACDEALRAINRSIDEAHELVHPAVMNPGSIDDWPLREQQSLFALFGGDHRLIGVELTDQYLMKPAKSVSGIRFSAERPYVNCQICTRVQCSRRSAPYQQVLYDWIYDDTRGESSQ